MLGYRVMENFNFPFFKKNLAEFWRSWHMSLTYWSRDYMYMTVVGVTRNPYYATLASFLFIGLWHELSLRYVIWGLYHGLGIILVGQFGRYMRKKKLKPIKNQVIQFCIDGLKIMATSNYFFFGYIITLNNSIADTLKSYWIILFSWWL
jgi:alginate O-acetyltransferase complex protein AlgI